jgi:hypothetical protein
VALEIKQKAIKAPILGQKTLVSKIFPAAKGAAKTSTFLAHCRGRSATNAATGSDRDSLT